MKYIFVALLLSLVISLSQASEIAIEAQTIPLSQIGLLGDCTDNQVEPKIQEKSCLNIIDLGIFTQDSNNNAITLNNIGMGLWSQTNITSDTIDEQIIKLKGAESYLKQAIGLFPKNAKYYKNLQRIYQEIYNRSKLPSDKEKYQSLNEAILAYTKKNELLTTIIPFEFNLPNLELSHGFNIEEYPERYILMENSQFLLTIDKKSALRCKATRSYQTNFDVFFNSKYDEIILADQKQFNEFIDSIKPTALSTCKTQSFGLEIHVNGFLLEQDTHRIIRDEPNIDDKSTFLGDGKKLIPLFAFHPSRFGKHELHGVKYEGAIIQSIEGLVSFNGGSLDSMSTPGAQSAGQLALVQEANNLTMQRFGAEFFGPTGRFLTGKVLVSSPAFLAGLENGRSDLREMRGYGKSGYITTCKDAQCTLDLLNNPDAQRFIFEHNPANRRFGNNNPDNDTSFYTGWFDKSVPWGPPLSQLPVSEDPDIWKKYFVYNAFGILFKENSTELEYVAPFSPAYFANFKPGENISHIGSHAISANRDLNDVTRAIVEIVESGNQDEFHRFQFRNDDGKKYFRTTFVASSHFPLQAGYAPNFDLNNHRYHQLVTKLKSTQEQNRAKNRVNQALFNAVTGLLRGGGNFGSSIATLGEFIDETNEADLQAYQARSRIYALQGNICSKKPSVVFCYNTYDSVTNYLGRGSFRRTNIVTNHCSGACAGHSGFCDMNSGVRYISEEAAELANCRKATDDELEPLLKLQ